MKRIDALAAAVPTQMAAALDAQFDNAAAPSPLALIPGHAMKPLKRSVTASALRVAFVSVAFYRLRGRACVFAAALMLDHAVMDRRCRRMVLKLGKHAQKIRLDVTAEAVIAIVMTGGESPGGSDASHRMESKRPDDASAALAFPKQARQVAISF